MDNEKIYIKKLKEKTKILLNIITLNQISQISFIYKNQYNKYF